MLRKIKEVYSDFQILIISITVYLLSIFIIAPWGNYAVGDDLYYFIQIEGFNNGSYIKNGHIDTSIVFQILIGQIWTKLFGLSFTSLRILSIIFTILIIIALFKVFKILNLNKYLSLITILVIIFNPKVIHASLSFNSEIYFLTFLLWSFYFLIKYEKTETFKYLIYSVIFSGLSVGVRQVGILFALVYFFWAILKYKNLKNLFLEIRKFIIPIIMFFTIASIGVFWPKQVTEFQENSKSLFGVIDFFYIGKKFLNLWKEIPYLSLLLFPYLTFLIKQLNNRKRFLLIIPSIFLGLLLTKYNVFSLGNTIYLEGVDARSYINLREHLFNNLVFKVLISLFLSYVFLGSILYIYSKIKIIALDKTSLLTLFTSILFLSSTLLADVSYDRYFLYFEVFFALFIALIINDYFVSTLYTNFSLTILIIFTIFYQIDYHQDSLLKWEIASNIAKDRGLKLIDTYVNETYLKYNFISEKRDFKGLNVLKPLSPKYQCFVLNYIKEEYSIVRNVVDKIDLILLELDFFRNISIKGHGYAKSQIKTCNNCQILYQKSYFSPMYSLYGKEKFVKAYCIDKLN